ncbi:hypothetical protein HD806DRAFT_509924, partial [Xylariaceae sp. AK1471]
MNLHHYYTYLIVQDIAKSVNYVHVFGFVHKGVRPEPIIGFEVSGVEAPSMFLVGFEDFRKEDEKNRQDWR